MSSMQALLIGSEVLRILANQTAKFLDNAGQSSNCIKLVVIKRKGIDSSGVKNSGLVRSHTTAGYTQQFA